MKRLFVNLHKNPKTNEISLINSEIYENETFEQNTQKEVWNALHINNIDVLKGEYYDVFEDKFGERTIHCSNICLLKESVPLDSSWYEIQLSDTDLVLQNKTEEYHIAFRKYNSHTEIVSSDILFAENNTLFLIDALLKLKNEFYFTPIVLNYVKSEFTIKEITEFFNCFSTKQFSKSTTKRRLGAFIEECPTQIENQRHILYKRR